MPVLERLHRAWKEHGTMGLVKHVFRTRSPVHFMFVYATTCRLSPAPVEGLSVERFPAEHAVGGPTMESLRRGAGDRMPGQLRRLFGQGAELWIGWLDGQVVGVCWSRSQQVRHDYFVPLGNADATILSCMVVPKYRGRGIYPAMLGTMVGELMDKQKVRRVLIDCKSWNKPSIRGIEKAGFSLVGKGLRVVCFGRSWILWNQCK